MEVCEVASAPLPRVCSRCALLVAFHVQSRRNFGPRSMNDALTGKVFSSVTERKSLDRPSKRKRTFGANGLPKRKARWVLQLAVLSAIHRIQT